MTANEPTPRDESGVQEDEYTEAKLAEESPFAPSMAPRRVPCASPPSAAPRRRRRRLPLILFLLTCASTFLAGAADWMPGEYLYRSWFQQDAMPLRIAMLRGWQDGLIYMGCVLAILLTHEMGHFIATLRYRIPASLPYFLPLPISPIGTMGAVIAMDGMRANRKEIFDIGLAGPLAGLAVALPITWIGIQHLDLTGPGYGLRIQLPLIVKWVVGLNPPPGYQSGEAIACSQLNPYFMAGWVGLLVTGLNMLPISQLDGGHVIYTLFGKPAAHWVARVFMLAVLVAICLDVSRLGPWLLMTFLVLLIGVSHPPTRDDTVPIGWIRVVIGLISLLIPLLCFNPYVLTG